MAGIAAEWDDRLAALARLAAELEDEQATGLTASCHETDT
jgi:hypothetical protein